MSDSDSFEDDDFLQEIIEKTDAVNRQVNESVVKHIRPVQRTLTGERLDHEDGRPARYEEIVKEVTYLPTHHEMNQNSLDRYIYPSNLQVRDYQFDIIKKALFKNLLCAIPTGMGKTFIASTVMLNYYRWFKKAKIIFMAPTRPLVAQQIQACLGVTDISDEDTAILLDKTRKNRPEIWSSKRVFFTTPQVVENDLKSGILDPKEICCLVIDEAHRARGNYAYTNVVKFIDRFNTSFRVLALTATPAADIEGVQEVVKNLHISSIEIRTEESFDIVKYMKRKETVRIECGMNSEMYDIVDLLSEAILPVLKKANEANIYEITDPSRINGFQAMQKSQAIVRNPSIPEGTKWNYYFILQLLTYAGQMLRRLKIYGVRTFYTYFQNKCKEFRTKWEMKKSTNKIAQGFFYHPALDKIDDIYNNLTKDKSYLSHPKIEHMVQELGDFFEDKVDSRVIVFTELRESALEIVKCLDGQMGDKCKAHIFIGQARGKEGFNEEDYKMKHGKKGRGKQKKLEREEKLKELEEEREQSKAKSAADRQASRTGTSEEAQIQGMNQKTQKELIKKFKKGEINVLVATSIGEEGLDIGEVDLIICYDSTSSPIKNIQRMGRTGRKRDGKVILLLSGSEESKFDQSMEEYASVQKQIAGNALEMNRSDRIIPQNIDPECIKTLIEIPEGNLLIARGEDEEEVIKYATQAMLGKKPKKARGKAARASEANTSSRKFESPPAKVEKRFFMPMNAQIGFVKSSSMVKKVGGENSGNSSNIDLSKADTSKNTSVSLLSDDETENSNNQVSENSLHLGKMFSTPNKTADSSFGNDGLIKPLFNSKSAIKKAHEIKAIKPHIAQTQSEDEFDVLDQDPSLENDSLHMSTPNNKKRKSLELPDDSITKQRKLDNNPSNEIKLIEDIFDSDSQSDMDSDSLDLIFQDDQKPQVNKEEKINENIESKMEIPQKEQPELTIIESESEDDGLDDSLNTVLESRSLSVENAKAPPLHLKILNFEACEDESEKEELVNETLDSYERPLKEAMKVMDKQYDEDISFRPHDSIPSSVTQKPIKHQSHSKKVFEKKENRKEEEKSLQKSDIFNLLKVNHENRRQANLNKKTIDLVSSIRPSQCIEIDIASQEVIFSQKKVLSDIYMSQRDNLYPTNLKGRSGMLTEIEDNEFVTSYYTSDFTPITPDPVISVKSDAPGRIGSSSVSKRFKNFSRLFGPNGERRLQRLYSTIEEAKLRNKPIGDTKIIIKDEMDLKVKIEDSNDSINLVSDDDEEFMNL